MFYLIFCVSISYAYGFSCDSFNGVCQPACDESQYKLNVPGCLVKEECCISQCSDEGGSCGQTGGQCRAESGNSENIDRTFSDQCCHGLICCQFTCKAEGTQCGENGGKCKTKCATAEYPQTGGSGCCVGLECCTPCVDNCTGECKKDCDDDEEGEGMCCYSRKCCLPPQCKEEDAVCGNGEGVCRRHSGDGDYLWKGPLECCNRLDCFVRCFSEETKCGENGGKCQAECGIGEYPLNSEGCCDGLQCCTPCLDQCDGECRTECGEEEDEAGEGICCYSRKCCRPSSICIDENGSCNDQGGKCKVCGEGNYPATVTRTGVSSCCDSLSCCTPCIDQCDGECRKECGEEEGEAEEGMCCYSKKCCNPSICQDTVKCEGEFNGICMKDYCPKGWDYISKDCCDGTLCCIPPDV